MELNFKETIETFVDYLSPELTPYQSSLYLYLLRNSFLRNGSSETRVGKRTIAGNFTKGARGEHTSYAHVSEILSNLERKGCIRIGDTNRLGTLYTIVLPKDIPLVAERIAAGMLENHEEDYFTAPNRRTEVFDRDNWTCQYCRRKVDVKNATLDHFVPQSKGGKHNRENLRTCCLVCNSIKSGKTFEEAAPLLLKRIQEQISKQG